MGGQGGCKRRIEVFVKIQKKKIFFFLGGGGGVRVSRVDVNEELKFFWEIHWGAVGLGWVRLGQDGCERRIEVFGKIKKN